MLRVGVNGLGRIGRAILRVNQNKKIFKIVAANDINPDISNIAYTINYDTLYGSLTDKYTAVENRLQSSVDEIRVYHEDKIDQVDWKSHKVDVVIDATGVYDNVMRARSAMAKNCLKKVIITHSPEDVDFTLILGANEECLDIERHHVIASSICDATAISPVLQAIIDAFGVEKGMVTTLHPWLSYQNLMDGPASSWSVPGEIYHHYALGRSVIGNMIPKPTSAMTATCRVVKGIEESSIGSFSYRTPNAIVASSDMSLLLHKDVSKQEVIELFETIQQNQQWDIIHNSVEPLVSLDFKQSEFSAIVDHRWTEVVQGNFLKLVLWYDNEWGYAARVVDQLSLITDLMKEKK